MEVLLDGLKCTGKWLYKHKYKIATLGALAVGATSSYYLSGSGKGRSTQRTPVRQGTAIPEPRNRRARTLLRARKEFDFAIMNFLPTLRKKITELIDVKSAVRKLAQVKAARREGQQADAEYAVWEEIKVETFSLFFTSLFMLCTLASLLKIQLHILARRSPAVSTGEDTDLQNSSHTQRLALYQNLLSSTYKHVLGEGLSVCARRCQACVKDVLKDWIVKTKLSVPYEELLNALGTTRRHLQGSTYTMANLTQENGSPDSMVLAIIQSPGKSEEAETKAEPKFEHALAERDSAQELLEQTWDVVDSALFQSAFDEAVDSCFSRCCEHLRVAYSTKQDEPHAADTPPLAMLIPQVRALSLQMLDAENENAFIKDISGGATLELLCTAVFDAQIRVDSEASV